MLTKMMRIDPDDRSDIEFLLKQEDFSKPGMIVALDAASVPEVPEIEEAFRKNREWLIGQL